ncbi:hypothetical protein HK407_01g01250 [Ordospora pajunii]|uniref:uncharacterized protein n=1 Tax=Ordospora pajunii TaxID=3039483 RepID=UPI00295264DD|nr:uncharacterized protein HK407_01g01250 [Ordospora pajunii]KAH9412232.1 hypothetical protein HK407_01g01250 [Ordospora pajunii]
MEDSMLSFVLGSIFMLGVCRSAHHIMHVLSSISLLGFVYCTASRRDASIQIKILGLKDISALIIGIAIESTLLAKSERYMGGGALKRVAACGLSLSITMFCISIGCLRKSVENRRFFPKGLYAYARHPLYLSLMVFWASCCVYASCFVSFAFFVWFTNFKVFPRMRDEESENEKIYTDYARYRKSTWSGVPMYR